MVFYERHQQDTPPAARTASIVQSAPFMSKSGFTAAIVSAGVFVKHDDQINHAEHA
jgi:hypothetical protein